MPKHISQHNKKSKPTRKAIQASATRNERTRSTSVGKKAQAANRRAMRKQ